MSGEEHDIKAPELDRGELEALSSEMARALASVVRSMTLVLETDVALAQREMLARAHQTGAKLLSQIEALRGLLASTPAKDASTPPTTGDLKTLIASLINERSSHAEALGLVLSSDVAPEVSERVHVDSEMLTSILGGLLDSSIRHAERGEVRLWVERDAAAAQLRVIVTSTRLNVAPPNEWHLNARVHVASQEAESASWALSRAQINKLGGRLRDELGGANLRTITVDMPEPKPSTETAIVEARDEGTHRRTVGRVLVAESNAIHASWLRRLLEREGYEVLQTASGVDAVDLARSSLLDMVFLSVDLHGMDGLEVARCLRAAERHRSERLALFALIGRDDHCSAQGLRTLIEARVDGCLESPVDDKALFALIREHKNRHDEEPPFDVAAVRDRFSGDHELLQVFVESFLETFPQQVSELQRAIEDDDATRVVFAAHAMRGGLAFLSAGPATRHLLALELRAELLERRSREALLAMLKSEIDRIGPMLKQVLETP